MTESVKVWARYDTIKDSEGETRRERNKRFGFSSPSAPKIKASNKLSMIFLEMGRRRGWNDGRPQLLSWSDIVAYLSLRKGTMSKSELEVVLSVDEVWCSAISEEVNSIRDRESKRND